jgi:hypothetical protein
MKRKLEQDAIAAPEFSLLGLPRELRVNHIHPLLALAPEDLGRLSRTCHLLHQELVRDQGGFLYFPAQWRHKVEEALAWDFIYPYLTAKLGAFITDKTLLRVFTGLGGAQSHLRLSIDSCFENKQVSFLIWQGSGLKCDFSYYFPWTMADNKCPPSLCGMERGATLPSAEAIAAMKDAARAKHSAILEKNRLSRLIPAALRDERTRLTREQSDHKSVMSQAVRSMWDCRHARDNEVQTIITRCKDALAAGERFESNKRRLEEIAREVQKIEEGVKEEPL